MIERHGTMLRTDDAFLKLSISVVVEKVCCVARSDHESSSVQGRKICSASNCVRVGHREVGNLDNQKEGTATDDERTITFPCGVEAASAVCQ